MPYYNRYDGFTVNGKSKVLPFIKIPLSSNDKYVVYNSDTTRFDRVSQRYYGDPTYGWLILLANPSKRIEFDFEDGEQVRIPFPLNLALDNYEKQVESYNSF